MVQTDVHRYRRTPTIGDNSICPGLLPFGSCSPCKWKLSVRVKCLFSVGVFWGCCVCVCYNKDNNSDNKNRKELDNNEMLLACETGNWTAPNEIKLTTKWGSEANFSALFLLKIELKNWKCRRSWNRMCIACLSHVCRMSWMPEFQPTCPAKVGNTISQRQLNANAKVNGDGDAF